jgi:hypothetical protein
MPTTIQIAEFVFGAFLIVLAIIGGKFELFGAKVTEISSSKLTRFISLLLGIFMLTLSLYGNPLHLLAKPQMSILSEVDYHRTGGSVDLASFPTDSVDDCSSRCEHDKDCVGFTYSNRQRKCFLKSKLGEQVPNRDTDSGIKHYDR